MSATLGSRGVNLDVGERTTSTRRSTGTTSPRRSTGTTSPRSSTGTTTPRRSTGSSSPKTRETVSRTKAGARATAAGVLGSAENYLGTPYVWGGATPSGFDCSGFVQYVFRRHGIALPRTSRQQAHVGQVVTRSLQALRPGDLMLFATNGVRIDHIGIYAGNGEMIHSSKSGGGVGYDRFSTRRGQWFVAHHVATRRVLADGRSLVAPLPDALRAFAELDPPDRAPRRK